MQTYKPAVIQRLFLKQIRNLTKYNTVYIAPQDDEDLYTDEGIDAALDEHQVSSREAGVMRGYLAAL
ncbi:hypothetical protein GF342_03665 [Candidatus Woesearchaeota archaeon]|nr:hypothetical protein [Candidatus Woesearchaeota archaeon]